MEKLLGDLVATVAFAIKTCNVCAGAGEYEINRGRHDRQMKTCGNCRPLRDAVRDIPGRPLYLTAILGDL
jgi:hypothetical protein